MCDEVVVLGIMPFPQTQFEQLRRVYLTGGVCPTIQSARNAQDTKVVEVWYVRVADKRNGRRIVLHIRVLLHETGVRHRDEAVSAASVSAGSL